MSKRKSETARQAYRRKYGRPDAGGETDADTGGLPDLSARRPHPVTESPLFRKFLWDHVRFARAHAKNVPLKSRRRLKPEDEAGLRWNLEMMVYQARHAPAYLKARDDMEEAPRAPRAPRGLLRVRALRPVRRGGRDMSDAMSQAKKDREHAEERLRLHGWTRISELSWWQDPLDPGGEPVRINSDLRIQDEGSESVREVMEARGHVEAGVAGRPRQGRDGIMTGTRHAVETAIELSREEGTREDFAVGSGIGTWGSAARSRTGRHEQPHAGGRRLPHISDPAVG